MVAREHFAEMVSIRLWTKADIDYVTESIERERWGYTKRDIERCWQFEPNGCFIAEVQNKPVGQVFSICYGKMGWIGLLIVNLEQRGKGVGTVLMQTAIDYLQKAGAETIRLEAAEKAVPLYKRLGFREEFDSLRLSKQLKQNGKQKPLRENIFPVQEEDIENMAEFDSKYFGANRIRVLKSLCEESPQSCFVAKEKQKIVAYVMSRKISLIHRIGPWVCAKENTQAASDLLITSINSIEEKNTELRIGTPAHNTNAVELLERLGFHQVAKSIRMIWGKHKHKGNVLGIYGIAGPEKG